MQLMQTSRGGGGTPGGSDTQVQYNSGGTAFAGDPLFTWNYTVKTLHVGPLAPVAIVPSGSIPSNEKPIFSYGASGIQRLTLGDIDSHYFGDNDEILHVYQTYSDTQVGANFPNMVEGHVIFGGASADALSGQLRAGYFTFESNDTHALGAGVGLEGNATSLVGSVSSLTGISGSALIQSLRSSSVSPVVGMMIGGDFAVGGEVTGGAGTSTATITLAQAIHSTAFVSDRTTVTTYHGLAIDAPVISGTGVVTNKIALNIGDYGASDYAIKSVGGKNLFSSTSTAPYITTVQTASDNCTRADENPMSNGGNWTSSGGGLNAGRLVSNKWEATTVNVGSVAAWTGNGASFDSADQYSQVTLAAATATNVQVGPCVRCSTAANTQYRLAVIGILGSTSSYTLFKLVAGAATTLIGPGIAKVFNVGDTVRLAILGTTLYCYQNGTLFASVTDTAIATGVPGMVAFEATGSIVNAQVSAWSGGTVTATSTTGTSGNVTLQNPTPSPAGVGISSPVLTFSGQYWSGAASGEDQWTIQSNIATGTNGLSALTFAHTGSSGAFVLSLPTQSTVTTPNLTSSADNTQGINIGPTGTTPAVSIIHKQTSATDSLRFYAGATGTTLAGTIQTQTTNGMFSVGSRSNNYTSAFGDFANASRTSAFACVAFGQQQNNQMNATAGTQVAFAIGGGLATDSTRFFGFTPASGAAKFVCATIRPTINQSGTATGDYTALEVNVTETSALGTVKLLLDLQAGATGGTSEFAINNVGVITKYNAITTVGAGVAPIYATVDLTAQSAAKTATTLYAVPATGAGMYKISWNADITTAATTSSVLGGTNGFQVLYTSPTDSVVKTTVAGNSVTSAGNTTGTATAGELIVYAKASTNIQYQFDYTSVGGTAMVYQLHIKCQYLG